MFKLILIKDNKLSLKKKEETARDQALMKKIIKGIINIKIQGTTMGEPRAKKAIILQWK